MWKYVFIATFSPDELFLAITNTDGNIKQTKKMEIINMRFFIIAPPVNVSERLAKLQT
jgi:hypothetical protein